MSDEHSETMSGARLLIEQCSEGLPRGETAETIGEMAEVYRVALHLMPQRTGKAVLVLEIGALAKKYPLVAIGQDATPVVTPEKPVRESQGFVLESQLMDPRNEPLMVEAKEIFQGTWV